MADDVVARIENNWGMSFTDTKSTGMHTAALVGDILAIKYLCERLGMSAVDRQDGDGRTPLFVALEHPYSERCRQAATWLVEHGADTTITTRDGYTIFNEACYGMPTEFVKWLVTPRCGGKCVPEIHLTHSDGDGHTPMKSTILGCKPRTTHTLILMGVPVLVADIPSGNDLTGKISRTIQSLVEWLRMDVAVYQCFVQVVLGSGVYGTTPRDVPPAHRSQLWKLRSGGNWRLRELIANYLGVCDGKKIKCITKAIAVFEVTS